MNFLRKTLLTNNLNTTDVELGNIESGSRTAGSSSYQPTSTNSSIVTEHPLAPLSSSALSITQSSQLEASLPATSPVSFHAPQTVTVTHAPNQSGPSTFSFSSPQTGISAVTYAPNQSGPSTETLQLSRKRTHPVEEPNNKIRIIELGPTVESTKVNFMFKVLIIH